MADRSTERRRELLEDLLIKRSSDTLDDAEERQLDSLLEAFPGIDREHYDAAVATVVLAALGPCEAMPESVQDKILAAIREI